MKYFNTFVVVLALGLLIANSRQQPPQPGPGPNPKPPVVVEEKPLIEGDGLHVLIVADKLTLSREHDVVVNSRELQGWLIDHNAQWKIVAPNFDTTSEPPKWQAAMKLPRQSQPWLIASEKGKPNFSGPLPTTLPATLEVLNRYAK